ncbi:hypothetical protein MTO96_047559 [Rhipicephalus appendiculatus]
MTSPGVSEENSQADLSARVSVPFPSDRDAEIVYNSLRIDSDPKRSGCSKKLGLEGNVLTVHFTAKEPKQLRVGVNSFFDFLLLAINTVHRFGPAS